MQPNQPPNPDQPGPISTPGASNNPYEFMAAPPEQPKKAFKLNSFGRKKMLIISGLLGFVILLIVVIVSMSGGNSGTATQLAVLTAEQQEIIRVSDVVLKLSKDSKTLATASTVKSSLTSEQQSALALLTSQGGKLAKGQLSSKLNKQNDEDLNSAAQSNNLDDAYNEYLQTSLADYQKHLDSIYNAGGPKTKAFAQQAYDSSKLITASL